MPESVDEAVDPAFAALLADRRMALRRPPPELPIEIIRAAANSFMASAVGPPVKEVFDLLVEGPGGRLPIRIYLPSDAPTLPVILFCHGGGFAFGNLDTHDAMCRTLAVSARAAVVAVDYRVAPDWPFPAALDDCAAALAWIRTSGAQHRLDATRLAIAGDSAGGQLAIATALSSRSIAHLALLYPMLDPHRASASIRDFGEGFMLTESFLEWAWEVYQGNASAPADPRFDLNLADLTGFPDTTVVTAALDPLRDEGEAFADRLASAGVAIDTRRFAGMIHGFAGMSHLTPVANEAIGYVGHRIAASFGDIATASK